MTEPLTTGRGTSTRGIPVAADEPTVPPEAAAVLAAAGIQVLTKKLANRWTLGGTATLGAVGAAALFILRWHRPLKAEG